MVIKAIFRQPWRACFPLGGLALLAACSLLSACVTEEDVLEVVAFQQAGRADVRLNEPLTFRFSGSVDPTSINSHTVTIVDDDGSPAVGRWQVTGNEVRFWPDPPGDEELYDGGLGFGTRYTIVFAGYPCSQTLLSIEGSRLGRKESFVFSTLDRGNGTAPFAPFVDPVPDRGPKLLSVNGVALGDIGFAGIELSGEAEIVLEFTEPIHPGSVFRQEARLHIQRAGSEPAAESETLPLRCALVPRAGNLQVRLSPILPLEQGRCYDLRIESLEFRDFGGKRIQDDDFSYIQFRLGE